MSDKEIIEGLLTRNDSITRQFLFVDCRPLLTAIMRLVFSYEVEYNELVNELYGYLMENDGARLRQFQYRSTIYQWMKVVATRFFIRHRNQLIENTSKEAPFEVENTNPTINTDNIICNKIDIANMLRLMDNQRYADAIRNLILKDIEPELYAKQTGVSVDNLYNIKKRAIAALTRIAIKYYGYEQ